MRTVLLESLKGKAAVLRNEATLRPILKVNGVGDFAAKSPLYEWLQWVAPPNERVTRAVTAGISSCAGGVTYSMGDDNLPDVVIMWHVDGNLTVPVQPLIRQLWPDLAKCPPLRTIAYIYPAAWELDKYREDNLYPHEIRDRCETVYLVRGTHLYHARAVVNCSADFFGVDVSDPANVALVFSHDINPHRVGAFKMAAEEEIPGMVVDVEDGVYGEVDLLNKQKPSREALTQFKTKLQNVKEYQKTDEDIKKASPTCRLPLTDAVFQELVKRGTVAGTPGFFCGEKADRVLMHIKDEMTLEDRFTTGNVQK
jgi:hypothetical protein